jgi:hypothetical protein
MVAAGVNAKLPFTEVVICVAAGARKQLVFG